MLKNCMKMVENSEDAAEVVTKLLKNCKMGATQTPKLKLILYCPLPNLHPLTPTMELQDVDSCSAGRESLYSEGQNLYNVSSISSKSTITLDPKKL